MNGNGNGNATRKLSQDERTNAMRRARETQRRRERQRRARERWNNGATVLQALAFVMLVGGALFFAAAIGLESRRSIERAQAKRALAWDSVGVATDAGDAGAGERNGKR